MEIIDQMHTHEDVPDLLKNHIQNDAHHKQGIWSVGGGLCCPSAFYFIYLFIIALLLAQLG